MKRCTAFTLIEVVLVTAILGMVLVSAYQILLITFQADERVTRNTQSGKIGSAILTILRRDLQGAVFQGLGAEVFLGVDGGEGEDAEDAVHFITTAPVPAPPDDEGEWAGDFASVGYLLANGEDEGKVLFRRVKWNIHDQPLDGGHHYPIYERVQSLSLRYLDGEGEWQESWNAEDRMPEPIPLGEDEEGEGTETGAEEDDADTEEEEALILPRAVEIVLFIYLGDEKGLLRDDHGEPQTERYSTVVPILVSEWLDLEEETLELPEEGGTNGR